jgi:pyruvate,water dikinase
LLADLFETNFTAGFADCFARYGAPLDRNQGRHVNGWFYFHMVPAGAPDNGRGSPPRAVLAILSRVVPVLRRRTATARTAIAERRWLVDAATWATERDRWNARIDALIGTELESLGDDALAAHVADAIDTTASMVRRHFELVGVAVGVGRLLVAADEWGIDRRAIHEALRGSSPASSASAGPLLRLADVVARSGCRPISLADIRALGPEPSRLIDDYLRRYGWRPLSTDVEAPMLAESPELLLDLIAAASPSGARPTAGSDAELRRRVPADDQARWDELLSEARTCYGCLDDNSGTVTWAFGALKRSAIEVARRGLRRGVLLAQHDVFDLSTDEIVQLARGGDGPGLDELRARAARRAANSRLTPPPVLGPAVTAPPDPTAFPAAMAEIVSAIGAYLGDKFTAPPTSARPGGGVLRIDGSTVATGSPVGSGSVTARVITASDPADAVDRLRPGDILACPFTTAAWNAVFPILGGLVTESGGPLGHAAVMAREFDIPAVVGVGEINRSWDDRTGTIAID